MRKLHEVGQGLMEYSLLIVLIAVLVMVVLYFIGPSAGNMLADVASSF